MRVCVCECGWECVRAVNSIKCFIHQWTATAKAAEHVCVKEKEGEGYVCVCVIGECVKVCVCEGNVCVPVRMQMLPHRGTKTLLPTATTITVH